ncbi:DUF6273 domain-containing protein [Olsenella sp. kh2p3]|uniref:DUF6273 domain-containing protein n=1 Tax=Olsenella sp. kh2p3 TaxID=1797112 RepID=UPI00091721B9|nr:DUF6273 domain-containing protein [Olsenella sp. kh2p3]SFX23058.1 hypothetical protein SAMN04487823_102162 [Olsenella sp. kh2p3]
MAPKHSRKTETGTGRGLLVAACIFVVLAVGVLVLAVTGRLRPFVEQVAPGLAGKPDVQTQQQDASSDTATSQVLEPKSFSEYSWDELTQISAKIAAADTDNEGLEIAREYNLADATGVPVNEMREVVLDDNTLAYARIVGFRHDQRADGSGIAGMTLMVSMLSEQPMEASNTNEGGWESSALRSWLAGDGMALLPDDLATHIVSVAKATNNAGITADSASVTQTSDSLWAFSAVEVCGQISWFEDEFASEISYTAGLDAVLNAEGTQYPYFASEGVTDETGGSGGALALSYRGSARSWWYRSAYPLNYADSSSSSYFFRVSETGFPSSVGQADSTSGVVAGFCI